MAWSQRTFANQILIEQSSAQSLHDCPQLELPSQAGLCHQNTNNQAFSTDLISTNWSIASNAQLSSRPLDFIMMHLMHTGGITTIVSCCRDMFMYQTCLNRNNDTETMGETQDQYCPLSMGPIVGDVLCHLHPERLFLSAHVRQCGAPPRSCQTPIGCGGV
jgi:hypothetical protein